MYNIIHIYIYEFVVHCTVALIYIRVAEKIYAPLLSIRGIRCKYVKLVLEDMYYVLYWNLFREVKRSIILRKIK